MLDRINEQPFCQTRVMCRAVDNLELLLSQPDESVDLIYCDILYGTGRNFGDYQDLKPIRSEIEAHYLPRLKEMHRVLKSTGSIYIHCDYNINHWVRCMLDDIFGYDNLLNEIIWRIGWCSGFKTKSKKFIRNHDTIYSYTKTSNFTFNKEYIKRDTLLSKRVLSANDLPIEDTWNCSEFDTLNSIQIMSFCKEKTGYYSQKPKALIERIIKASSNEGDTVADYYLGSGTTAVVCKELNRNFIGCDINPKAIEITNARLDAVS